MAAQRSSSATCDQIFTPDISFLSSFLLQGFCNNPKSKFAVFPAASSSSTAKPYTKYDFNSTNSGDDSYRKSNENHLNNSSQSTSNGNSFQTDLKNNSKYGNYDSHSANSANKQKDGYSSSYNSPIPGKEKVRRREPAHDVLTVRHSNTTRRTNISCYSPNHYWSARVIHIF